ncbi:MAG: hypothetical protein M3R15_24280 [Acidobacteriota bacterium]|nr:hypothetical protein [Acidobacteriota bacterium]
MSKIITSQVRNDWAEATFRYDDETVFDMLYAGLYKITRAMTVDERDAAHRAHELATRAHTLFSEKLPAQLDTMMQKLLTDAGCAALTESFMELVPELLSVSAARRQQAEMWKVKDGADAFMTRQVWDVRGKGAPAQLTKEELMSAIEACRARDVPPTCDELGVETGKDSTTIRRAARRYELEDKIELRKLRK